MSSVRTTRSSAERPAAARRTGWAAIGPRAITLLALASLGLQGGEPARGWKFPDLPAVRGITLGTTLPDVRAGLGKPGSEKDDPAAGDELGMGPTKDLGYPGLVVQLCRPDADREFHVWQIEVSGKEWSMTPGLKVGMTRREVTRLLGSPGNSDVGPDGRTERIHYSLQPPLKFGAYVWVELSGGKVTTFGMTEDWS